MDLSVDLRGPFRGSVALAAGALRRGVLAGPRFRRLYPDVYVPAELPVDLVLRSRAAALLVGPAGVLAGYSAAELLDASCGPWDAPAEVTVPRFRRPLPGLLVHRDRLHPDELATVGGVVVTSPARTAFDLARWRPLVEGVTAVDSLAHRHAFTPADLRVLRSRHLGAPFSRKLEAVLALADPRAQSPMESRIRVALARAGIPPCVQHPVTVNARTFALDMAYPAARLGVEHDGAHHREPDQALRDLEREALLTAAGWKIIRFSARIVLGSPQLIVVRIREELRRRTVIAHDAT